MTDEERYPPPYEQAALAEFRRTQLPARERLRAQSRELHRHYAGATACTPSRTTLFTGQYASLHGVADTDGLAKAATDPAMHFLDPDTVPTMGDWFRAAGYRTHYRGKWHISHPDLTIPGTHESLKVNDAEGVLDPVAVDAYRRADRLDPYGFSGWIGREPHGADKADTGIVRDGVFAQEICDLFAQIAAADDDVPWLAVASFVNPHDIAFTGAAWSLLGFPPIADSIPEIPEAPSQSDSFAGRPDCQLQFKEVWPKVLYPQDPDGEYRRLYHFLQVLVDAAIMRILDELHARGLADDTIVVFTSDHGDMLGAHGGLLQKWHNAFDESIRVPLLVSGPGIDTQAAGRGGRHQPPRPRAHAARARRRRRRSRRRRGGATPRGDPAVRRTRPVAVAHGHGHRRRGRRAGVLHDRRPGHHGPAPEEPLHRRAVRSGGGAGQGRVASSPASRRATPVRPSCGSATTTTTASTARPRWSRSGSCTTSPPIPRSAPTSPRATRPHPCSRSCARSSNTLATACGAPRST